MWRATALLRVPIYQAPNDFSFCNLQTALAVVDVLYYESASHLFDQSAEQCEQVFLGFGDNLELIARRVSVAKFEGVQGDACSQERAEMKFVRFARAVGQPHGFQVDMLEVVESCGCRGLRIETACAELFVSLIHRAVIDDLEAWRPMAAAHVS